MKRRLLLAALAVVGAFGGGNSLFAYTTSDLESAGWTQITSISQSDIANNFYVFVANDANLMLGLATSTNQSSTAAFYQTLEDPVLNAKKVWTLEANGTNYAMRNLYSNSRQMQTEWSSSNNDLRWRTNDQPGSISWTGLGLAYADGAWTLTSTQYSRPLGIYNNVTGTPTEGQEIGANDSGNGQKFKIYAINREAYWNLAAKQATSSNPVSSFTGKINNQEIYNKTQTTIPSGWTENTSVRTADNNNRTAGTGVTMLEGWASTQWGGNGILKFDYYQDISELPNGLYRLTANAGQDLYTNLDADAASNGVVYISNGTEDKTVSVTTTTGDITTPSLVCNSGSLKIGLRADGKQAWVHATDFRLEMIEPYMSIVAETLSSDGGSLTADQWYKFTVASSGDYGFSPITNIVLSSNGDQLLSQATGDALAETVALTAGTTYYIKSTTAQSLTITPKNYTYTVGSATTDITYIQAGKTVTVSYADLATNNTAATLTTNYSGITFNDEAITATATANGFTFTVPTVTANTDYILTIPANAIGYEVGNTYNAAQSITLKTPAVFDGTYFFRAAATWDATSEGTSAAVGKYMARGTAYGTHLSLDNYGLPVKVTTDGTNLTKMQMADTEGYVFSTGSYDAYADGSSAQSTTFTLSIQNGKYLIASNNRGAGKYLKYNTANASDEEISVFDDGTGTNSGPIILWAIESINEHATVMQAKKDTQAANAADAAYASGNYASLSGITTVTALESELTANYIKGDFKSASEITSVQESYQPRNNSASNLLPVTVYSNTINITQAGFYKFSMQAFNRATWNENVQAMHNAGADLPAAVLFFGDSETQIKSLYDETGHDTAVEGANPADAQYNGTYYANCKVSALKMFKDGKYHNDVWFYCATPGEYTYGVKVMGYAAGQWFIYSPESVTITSYAAAADANDYAALNTAISNYEAVTWGFEADEYAPYNNVEAITNYAAAKAIDQTTTNSKLLVNSLTTSLQLSEANTEEVNAVYWKTDYTAADKASDTYVHPIGWTNTGYNTRIMCAANDATDNPAMTTIGTAVFSKLNTTYGEIEGYTMPLKANTTYKISFKYCGWGNNPTTNVVITGTTSNQAVLVTPSSFQPATNDGNTNAEHWYDFTAFFTPTASDNYVLALNKVETGQQQIAWADLSIVKGTVVNIEANGTASAAYDATQEGLVDKVVLNRPISAGYNTLVLPFDVTAEEVAAKFGEEAKVYVVSEYESAKDNIKLAAQEGIEANKPVILKATTAGTSYEFTNKTLVAAEAAPTTVGTGVSMVGNYTAVIDVPKNSNAYVINGDKIYYVDSDVIIRNTRAYIYVEGASGIKSRVMGLSFGDEDATGINAVEGAKAAENDAIYNLSGQRVGKDYKGIVIKNGKKVMMR